jgi:NAD(P)-dependent dehydrogenase (short-subunit alcohol dehydrogenase family)
MDLRGKTALVTGGAHRVGRSIVLGLAEKGADVIVHYNRSRNEADATVEAARSCGVQAHSAFADLTQPDGVRALFAAVDSASPRLDVLVNSAAVLETVGLLEATPDDWEATINLNLKAAFFCLQEAARRMKAQGGGAIVNISDVAGRRPWRRYPIHSISKAGIEMLTRVAALALAPDVRVNGVAPGPVEKPPALSMDRWEALGRALPLRRTGSARDVAAAVIFCLEQDYLIGETIPVDGGDSIR